MGKYLAKLFEDVEPLDKQMVDYIQSVILYIKSQIPNAKVLPTDKILSTVNNKFDMNLDSDAFVELLSNIPFIVSVNDKEISLTNEETPTETKEKEEKENDKIEDTAKEQAKKDEHKEENLAEESVDNDLDEFYQGLFEEYKKGSK